MVLVKAKLVSSDGGGTIDFMFNPIQLAFKQSVRLNKPEGARTGRGLPKVSFAYPEPCILTISDIWLDTYEEAGSKSVLTHIQAFEKAVNFAEAGEHKEKRPPTFLFTWGEQQYIRCFVTDLNYTLTMFLPDGTPVRAKLDLTLEEVDLSTTQPGMGSPKSVDRAGDTRASRST